VGEEVGIPLRSISEIELIGGYPEVGNELHEKVGDAETTLIGGVGVECSSDLTGDGGGGGEPEDWEE